MASKSIEIVIYTKKEKIFFAYSVRFEISLNDSGDSPKLKTTVKIEAKLSIMLALPYSVGPNILAMIIWFITPRIPPIKVHIKTQKLFLSDIITQSP